MNIFKIALLPYFAGLALIWAGSLLNNQFVGMEYPAGRLIDTWMSLNLIYWAGLMGLAVYGTLTDEKR